MTARRGIQFSLARITIEMQTAFRVGARLDDDLHDAVFTTDANGLPAIPGTSIAGVLRHAYAAAKGVADPHAKKGPVADLFGFQQGEAAASSLVSLSWGHAHDQHDRPVPFLGATLAGDPVLELLWKGVVRDHVRISEAGVVDDAGKFDELVVPAGSRFTFEIKVEQGATSSSEALDELIALLASPHTRIGGKTRNGLGAFKVVRAARRTFNLSDRRDYDAWCKVPTDLAASVPPGVLESAKIPAPLSLDDSANTSPYTVHVPLIPEDSWIFGGGDKEAWSAEEDADILPVREQRISYSGGRGTIDTSLLLIPGSSIKGALRHRTLFHIRRREEDYWEAGSDQRPLAADTNPTLASLFGSIKANDGSGTPGRVRFRDIALKPAQTARFDHVSIDRFTQGPMDHHLFNELTCFGGSLELEIDILPPAEPDDDYNTALQAFADALEDLCEGNLSLGAASSRGHGYFAGTINRASVTREDTP